MDHLSYERPREKLRRRGVAYLTSIELMQLIIGSGYVKASSARIARQLIKAVERGVTSYNELIEINGLGNAKVCQILAVLEWARRFPPPREGMLGSKERIWEAINEVQRLGIPGVTCYWYDGAGQLIDKKQYTFTRNETPTICANNLFSDVIAVSARSILITITLTRGSTTPSTAHLDLLYACKNNAALVGIQIIGMYGISKLHVSDWAKELV